MKKVLALVLAAVMAFSMATVLSAAPLGGVNVGGAELGPWAPDAEGDYIYNTFYGEDSLKFMLENSDVDDALIEAYDDALEALDDAEDALALLDEEDAGYDDAVTAVNEAQDDVDDALDALMAAGFFILGAPVDSDGYVGADAFRNTGNFSLSVSVSSDNADMKASYRLVKNDARNAVGIEIILAPAAEKFTVAEPTGNNYKVKVKVVQKLKGATDPIVGEMEIEGVIQNTRADHTDAYTDASGNYFVDAPSLDDVFLANGKDDNARVIDVSVFEEAEGKGLTIDYDKYAVKFAKVSKQNTSLYLYAKTGVVSVTDTKAIGSIGFQPTRVKDAATITMPISFDNQNFYGETVYVYNVVDGKPTGEAIAAEVVNHNSIVFTVPAGTALGTFAAYGAKTEGDAEKPAIPETGANDIVNIAIVFAVVALAAAGFVAVKKAGK